MKRLSLQWRITLMTVLLIGVTCVVMNLLLCSSGVYYMDTIADTLQGGDTVMMNSEGAESFNPQLVWQNFESPSGLVEIDMVYFKRKVFA